MRQSGDERRHCHALKPFLISSTKTMDRFPRSTKVKSVTSCTTIFHNNFLTNCRFAGTVQDISKNTENSANT